MKGWLVNDFLTCIPNTKTFWHDLLEWFPELEDKTGYGYDELPEYLESIEEQPDYIIRNATFFRPLEIDVPQISLLQDIYTGVLRNQQIEVCNRSAHVVFNTPYVYEQYKDSIKTPFSVIPLGSCSVTFRPLNYDKDKNTIIFVGSTQEVKGFELLQEIIDGSSYKFILVLKDNTPVKFKNKNVSVYRSIDQTTLNELLNLSDLLICTSREETLHLAGVEALLAGTPVIAPEIGIYPTFKDDRWGLMVDRNKESYLQAIKTLLNSSKEETRSCAIEHGLTKESCRDAWTKVVENLK